MRQRFIQDTYLVEVAVVDEDSLVVRDRDNSRSAVDDLCGVIGDCFANGEWEPPAMDCA